MQVHKSLLIGRQHSTEVFQSSPVTVKLLVSAWNQWICQVEVIFHEKANVDGGDGKEEVSFIVFHLLDELAVSLDKPDDQLQWQDSSSSKISLRVLALEAKFKPLLAWNFDRLPKVLQIQGLDQIPPLIFPLEQDVGFLLEVVKSV